MHRPVLLFLCCFGCLIASNDAVSQSDNFQKVQNIILSDPNGVQSEELLISEINSLDIDSSGRILIVDLLGEQAFLFDSSGSLLAVLDPSSCHPGFEFRPVNAVFFKDRSIFLENAGPWGYRFTGEGKCLGDVHEDYTLAQVGFLDVDHRGNLVGLYRMPFASVIRYMSPEGETLREIELPASKFPNANSTIAMGGIVVDDTHIFYAGALETEILKISHEGTIESSFSHRHSWFQKASKDIPSQEPGRVPMLFQAAGDLFANSTLASSIFDLTNQMVMVQYSNPGSIGYQVFTKEGIFVMEELGVSYRFKAARNGLVYRIVQPSIDETGLPNPFIEVYRFVDTSIPENPPR